MKILPFNEEPLIKTYTYYGYEMGIISADERVGKMVTRFHIDDYEEHMWEKLDGKNIVSNINGDIHVEAGNDYGQGLDGCIYRDLKEDDVLCCRIDTQQYSTPWGAVNVFITNTEKHNVMDDDNYIARVGYFNHDGMYFRINNEVQAIQGAKQTLPVELLIHYKAGIAEIYASDAHSHLKLLGIFPISDNRAALKIGAQYQFMENTFHNWFSYNFIQMCSSLDDEDRVLEYFQGSAKNWNYHINNYFLDYNQCDMSCFGMRDRLHFVENCILRECYVEMFIDHYYLTGYPEYLSQHHFHQCLIYGYDDKKREFYVCGYDNRGKLQPSKLTAKEMKKCLQYERNNSLCEITYQQDWYPCSYDESRIERMIREYVEGTNSSQYILNMPTTKRNYGLKVYEDLMSEKGFQFVLEDRRITYLIHEHAKYMRYVLEYMVYMGSLQKNSAQVLNECDELIQKSYDLVLMVVKYRRTGREELCEKIRQLLKVVALKDREFMEGFAVIFDQKN